MDGHGRPQRPKAQTLNYHAEMPWFDQEETKEFLQVEEIRAKIVHFRGVLPPRENSESMALMAVYYSRMCERVGKFKAQRDEYFAVLLSGDDNMRIGRAEALAAGSEFGYKAKYYEAVAAGYLEIVNSLKKIQDYHEQTAKNHY